MEDKARDCKRLCENIDSLSKEMRSEMLAVIDDYTALIKEIGRASCRERV